LGHFCEGREATRPNLASPDFDAGVIGIVACRNGFQAQTQ
jgi:hypothetical protein